MRTTVELDDDVLALIAAEQRRTGESRGQAIGRLIRRASAGDGVAGPPLPSLDGGLLVDITDVSSLLARLDDADTVDRQTGSADVTP